MKIKADKALIITIYILSFLIAISQLRYQLYLQSIWFRIYRYSIYLSLIFCVVVLIYSWRKGKVTKLSILLVGYLAYELIVSYITGMSSYRTEIIYDVLPWPLLWCTFYEYFRKNDIPKCFKAITIVGLTICCVLSVPNIASHLTDYGRRGAVIFPIYFTFAYLTVILLDSTKRMKLVFSALIMALLIMSTKRAGFLATFSGVAVYFFIDAYVSSTLKERWKKYGRFIIGGIIVVAIGIYSINNYEIAMFERIMSIFDDAGSNRIYIWEDVMNHFQESSILEKLFGHGFHAVFYKVQPYGYPRMAHNSFMETLYDYGIVGLGYLLIIIGQLFRYFYMMLREKSRYAAIMGYTLMPILYLGLFSYFFEETKIIVPFVIAWGIMMGQMSSLYKNRKCENEDKNEST
ncbi:O-antigen ligase [Lachnospiraceae bacterium PM6-15]|uniref:O-antigen ligase family protein n=1 Tax=Ohessyouella blattaphilus TaxID=2949333 RepID=A0ABT1EG57_9FIRM|nr:O-antigen ligase family protein [Ohessyouella blattaphilus]MCP1109491.1 O-antigen ligase family protein [Ohessyouella blattaphilus]MCR8562885.1 O-antigen ligase family protein [Ohessyouella blattaphilus]